MATFDFRFLSFRILEYMLQVNPADRPDIKELLTGLEAIAIAMDVDLKGRVVSFVSLFALCISLDKINYCLRLSILNNWLLVGVRPWSFGCTWELAKHERSISQSSTKFLPDTKYKWNLNQIVLRKGLMTVSIR